MPLTIKIESLISKKPLFLVIRLFLLILLLFLKLLLRRNFNNVNFSNHYCPDITQATLEGLTVSQARISVL